MSEPTRDEKLFDGFLAVVALLFAIPLMLFEGWAVSRMWEWSVVEAFTWPALPPAAAVAVIAVWSYLRARHHHEQKPKPGERALGAMIASALFTSLLLASAYAARLVFT